MSASRICLGIAVALTALFSSGAVDAQTVVFNSSGTWTVPSSVSSVNVLVVGGGGGGGAHIGGGGGAGQVVYTTNYVVTPGQNISITIGAGGAGGIGGGSSLMEANSGANGGSSAFGSITVAGGGGGGGAYSNGANGGCGGGAGGVQLSYGGSGVATNPGTGSGGGNGGTSGSSPWRGGGGGGAGGAGVSGPNGSKGGQPVTYLNYTVAGGGGGGNDGSGGNPYSATIGAGAGWGGYNQGNTDVPAGSATANTGSGGGGGGGGWCDGGSGGSGLVVISENVTSGNPPSITSSLSASGTVGTAFNYQITASNNPTSYSAVGLASGLILNSSTGAISGTPAASGQTNVTLSAANAYGTGPSSTLVINITAGSGSTVVFNSSGTWTVPSNVSSVNVLVVGGGGGGGAHIGGGGGGGGVVYQTSYSVTTGQNISVTIGAGGAGGVGGGSTYMYANSGANGGSSTFGSITAAGGGGGGGAYSNGANGGCGGGAGGVLLGSGASGIPTNPGTGSAGSNGGTSGSSPWRGGGGGGAGGVGVSGPNGSKGGQPVTYLTYTVAGGGGGGDDGGGNNPYSSSVGGGGGWGGYNQGGTDVPAGAATANTGGGGGGGGGGWCDGSSGGSGIVVISENTGSTDGIGWTAVNLPSAAASGQTISFSVSIQNTGTTTWTSNYSVQMVDPNSNVVGSAIVSGVAPGGSATPTITMTLPNTAGTIAYTFRALDGQTVFGATQASITLSYQVIISSFSFGADSPAIISTGQPLNPEYRLRAKFTGGSYNQFHTATTFDNNGYPLDVLPTPGTYQATLYWIQYDSTGENILNIGPSSVVNVTISQPTVILSTYKFPENQPPVISTTYSPLNSVYRLRATFVVNGQNFDAAVSTNNNGLLLDQLPGPGTYQANLYWVQYDSTGTIVQQTGASFPVTVTITAANSMTFSEQTSVPAAVSGAFSFKINASGGATSYTATGLPNGLSIDSSTGLISGTPTTTGIYNVSVTATGPAGSSTTTITITVASAGNVSSPGLNIHRPDK